jgi:hypothetical protein
MYSGGLTTATIVILPPNAAAIEHAVVGRTAALVSGRVRHPK